MKRWDLCLIMTMALAFGLGAEELAHGGITVRVEGGVATEWAEVRGLLEEQLRLSGDNVVSEPLADDLAFFTRQHYLTHGWEDAVVDWKLSGGAILLAVEPGIRIKIGRIAWEGDLVVDAKELEKLLLRPLREPRGKHRRKFLPWVDAEIEEGAKLVNRRLRAEGYLEVATSLRTSDPKGAETRDITVAIRAGPRFTFGTISVTGAPDWLAAEIDEVTGQRSGTPFNEAEVENTARRVKGICEENGHLGTKVDSGYRLPKGGSVDVTLVINAPPRAAVREVEPAPHFSKGATRVLRSVFKPALSKPYSTRELELMFRRALDTGNFARLDYSTAPAGASDTTLLLDGEEVKPQSLAVKGGYETLLGPIAGLEYRHTNLWNTGNRLRALAELSGAGPVAFVQITDPAIFGTGFALTADAGLQRFDRFNYVRESLGSNLTLTRRVTIPFSWSLFTGYSLNQTESTVLTPAELGDTDYANLTGGAGLTLDFRDSQVLPTRGWMLDAKMEAVMAGDAATGLRTELRGSFFHPITDKLRLMLAARYHGLQGVTAEELPIDLRVFNGGAGSVRSFAERELGPLSERGDTPIGGVAAFSANAELSYAIIKNLDLAVFGDIGSLSTRTHRWPFNVSSDFRYAIGAGLRYHLPFGPIRIDYGWNPNRRDGEASGALHVGVGFAF